MWRITFFGNRPGAPETPVASTHVALVGTRQESSTVTKAGLYAEFVQESGPQPDVISGFAQYDDPEAFVETEEIEESFCAPVIEGAAAVVEDFVQPRLEDEQEPTDEGDDSWTPQLFDPWTVVDAITYTASDDEEYEEVTDDWAQGPIFDEFPFSATLEAEQEKEESTEDSLGIIFDDAVVPPVEDFSAAYWCED